MTRITAIGGACVNASSISPAVIGKVYVLALVEHVPRAAEPLCANNASPYSSCFDAVSCLVYGTLCGING